MTSDRCAAGIVFAVPVEADAFERRAGEQVETRAAGLVFREGNVAGRRVAWCVAGVGRERAARARAARAPAYTVFNDETLEDLVARRPTSTAELLEVRGIGPIKASRFGDEVLAIIASAATAG